MTIIVAAMKRPETLDRQIGVRLPRDVMAWLEKRAEKERRGLSQMVRLILADAMHAERANSPKAKK
jgi:hypothetical protein